MALSLGDTLRDYTRCCEADVHQVLSYYTIYHISSNGLDETPVSVGILTDFKVSLFRIYLIFS